MNMHEYKPHEQLGERVMLDKGMIPANANKYKNSRGICKI